HNIWGTMIDLVECKEVFNEFLRNFKKEDRKIKDGLPVLDRDREIFYERYLNKIYENEEVRVNLDVQNLLAYQKTVKLYHQLLKYPHEIIPLMDNAILEYYKELHGPNTATQELRIRPFNLCNSVNMRDLNPSDIDQLVSIKGLLIRASPLIPDMKIGFFRCSVCGNPVERVVERGKIDEPDRCPRPQCNSKNVMDLIHNRCTFSDRQVCRLQETPDSIPDGQTPHSVTLYLFDDLVDVARPGDRLEITGIFRSVPIRVNTRQRTMKSLFKTFIDVLHVRKTDNKRLAVDSIVNETSEKENNKGKNKEDDEIFYASNKLPKYDELDEIPDHSEGERIERYVEISQLPNLYEILSNSLAPSIYELDD
ncbi:1414_t:CDS:2, partial [Ambispora leptoticha]